MTHFTHNQPVTINFTGEAPFTLIGRVLKNIDDTCHPLTNMWRVEVTEGTARGSRFGVSGEALAVIA